MTGKINNFDQSFGLNYEVCVITYMYYSKRVGIYFCYNITITIILL